MNSSVEVAIDTGPGGRRTPLPEIEAATLTGCFDKPYAIGLVKALVSKGMRLDVIGSDEVDSPELHESPRIRFHNLRKRLAAHASLSKKVWRIVVYYVRLLRYAQNAKPKIFHILWNNKLLFFDRTLLMLYYKLLGKKVVFTAHNINAGIRDSSDSLLNRITLKIQYELADHIFVHTEKMKSELINDFGIDEQAISVIPFGINNCAPNTGVTPEEAKQQLGILQGDRTILFFGNIGPYKGLEFLVAAFQRLAVRNPAYRLIIAGKPRGGCDGYLEDIQRTISLDASRDRVSQRIEYISDDETELYFKAADVLALPYTHISQSGVLFLGYSFGLPVIAADVGSLKEDVVEGRTGFVCKPCDPVDLANRIETYFESDLFRTLSSRRQEIREFAESRHSWDVVGDITRSVYADLLGLALDPARDFEPSTSKANAA